MSSIEPALKRLIDAGFVVRHADPIRAQRPTYALADPFLQFHYAILEPHGPLLRDRDPRSTWERRLSATFSSQVRGPVFEEQARTWVRRYADTETLGGDADYVGPSAVVMGGVEHQLDVVVAAADSTDVPPARRTVRAIGEAKAGDVIGPEHVRRLERARATIGARAAHAKLLLFAPAFADELRNDARRRADLELIDLDRLYRGS